jgi:hypothetical protein
MEMELPEIQKQPEPTSTSLINTKNSNYTSGILNWLLKAVHGYWECFLGPFIAPTQCVNRLSS